MAWRLFFDLAPDAPLLFVHNGVKINLRNPNFPIVKLFRAYQSGCRYLQLTAKGRAKFADKLALTPLPDKLPSDLADRHIEILGDGLGLFTESDVDIDTIDARGSGSGSAELESETPAEEVKPTTDTPADKGIPTPKEVVAAALEKGILVKSGTVYLFGEQRVGTKAILKNESILGELRTLIAGG